MENFQKTKNTVKQMFDECSKFLVTLYEENSF
jgi:hypothetical protein